MPPITPPRCPKLEVCVGSRSKTIAIQLMRKNIIVRETGTDEVTKRRRSIPAMPMIDARKIDSTPVKEY